MGVLKQGLEKEEIQRNLLEQQERQQTVGSGFNPAYNPQPGGRGILDQPTIDGSRGTPQPQPQPQLSAPDSRILDQLFKPTIDGLRGTPQPQPQPQLQPHSGVLKQQLSGDGGVPAVAPQGGARLNQDGSVRLPNQFGGPSQIAESVPFKPGQKVDSAGKVITEEPNEIEAIASKNANDTLKDNPVVQKNFKEVETLAPGSQVVVDDILSEVATDVTSGKIDRMAAVDEIKSRLEDTPWYQDPKWQRAALGFGLAMLAGASPREALFAGGSTIGSSLTTEQGKIDELDLQTIDAYKEHIKRTEAITDRDLGFGENTKTREALVTANQLVAGAKIKAADKKSTADIKATKIAAAATVNAAEITANAKIVKEKKERDLKTTEKIETIQDKIDNSAIHKQEILEMRELIKANPWSVGPFDNQLSKAARAFDDDPQPGDFASINKRVDGFSKGKAMDIAQDLKGAFSDRDIKFVEAQVPQADDNEGVWERWFDNVERQYELLEQFDQKRLKRTEGKLTGSGGGNAEADRILGI